MLLAAISIVWNDRNTGMKTKKKNAHCPGEGTPKRIGSWHKDIHAQSFFYIWLLHLLLVPRFRSDMSSGPSGFVSTLSYFINKFLLSKATFLRPVHILFSSFLPPVLGGVYLGEMLT